MHTYIHLHTCKEYEICKPRVCMHVCMCVCMYRFMEGLLMSLCAHFHVYTHICLYIYIHDHDMLRSCNIHVYRLACMHACTYKYIDTSPQIHTYIHAYIHICILIQIRRYTPAHIRRTKDIQTYAPTHTHKHTQERNTVEK